MPKTLLAISCTPVPNSNSAALLEEFCKGAASEGVVIERISLYDLNLPYLNYTNINAQPPESPENKDMRRIESLIMKSSGLVIATPIWNFSVPAILKNMIDRISYFGRAYKEPGKPRQPNLTHLHSHTIFTAGAPWYALPMDVLAVLTVRYALWYFGVKNWGTTIEFNCGNGSKNVVKDRPKVLKKCFARGAKFAKRYLKD